MALDWLHKKCVMMEDESVLERIRPGNAFMLIPDNSVGPIEMAVEGACAFGVRMLTAMGLTFADTEAVLADRGPSTLLVRHRTVPVHNVSPEYSPTRSCSGTDCTASAQRQNRWTPLRLQRGYRHRARMAVCGTRHRTCTSHMIYT